MNTIRGARQVIRVMTKAKSSDHILI